jgi:hypothetical protein
MATYKISAWRVPKKLSKFFDNRTAPSLKLRYRYLYKKSKNLNRFKTRTYFGRLQKDHFADIFVKCVRLELLK